MYQYQLKVSNQVAHVYLVKVKKSFEDYELFIAVKCLPNLKNQGLIEYDTCKTNKHIEPEILTFNILRKYQHTTMYHES